MNNSTQAQKGFKTFLLTLSVSLIIFSVIYYVITNSSTRTESLPKDVVGSVTETQKEQVAPTPDKKEDESTFGKLAYQQVNVESRAVLAGATVSTSSTSQTTTSVPQTGMVGVTFGLVTSGLLFILAMTMISKDPRRLAMNSFERKTLKKL